MDFYNQNTAQVLNATQTNFLTGLSSQEANERLKKHGSNELKAKKQANLIQKFIAQFADFMIIILLIAAGISFVTSLLQGEADITEPVVILLIVVLNAVLGVFQESRAEHAIEALKKMNTQKITVLRDGKKVLIPGEDVTFGDILIVETGDLIPADARIIESINLKIEESSLTGESEPIEKHTAAISQTNLMANARKNMLFSGTAVVNGRGKAVVTAIGMQTEIGKIAHLINEHKEEQTPLQKKLATTGKILGICALIICALIFVIGVIHGQSILNTFMIAISLAVAAIPEGLPAIVTIVLALGVQKMAKKNAVIRRLPAVETLGGATVICADKTGTLTKNLMSVSKVADQTGKLDLKSPKATEILSHATLCNNSEAKNVNNEYIVTGDPTETAIVVACANNGVTKAGLEHNFRRIKEIPFNSTRKMMSTVHSSSNGFRVISKGAPEIILSKCNIDPQFKRKIEATYSEMASNALRVLAVAYKDVSELGSQIESNLTFVGLIGMIDPPRDDVKSAVALCKRAGIKPVMITGDHAVTASAIAKKLGILTPSGEVILGKELDSMSETELKRRIKNCCVFARVSPEHKMRIVKAYRSNGEVVAMTGDGVNDAPALKAADIGCAMGKNGTEVAKNAADMVLTDDNFSTIVEAVRQGRGIYDNIKKSVHFLLSCNVGEIITIFIASLLGFETPLFAIQLLFVNLVTDSLPAISLGLEATESDVMFRRPVDPKKSIFTGGLTKDILCEGMLIGVLTLLGFVVGSNIFGSADIGRTIAFCVLSISQLVHAFNVRSEKSLFDIGFFGNKQLCISFVICLALQVIVVVFAPLASIFKTVPLDRVEWLVVFILSFVPLLAVEVGKRLFNRSVYK